MTEKASAQQAMFNVIDNLTDISQLTDYVFNNDESSSSPNCIGNQGDSLGREDAPNADNAAVGYQKLATSNLEADTSSSLSLFDHGLTDEEVYRYLSLFNENNLQLVDELDLENSLQPCSSINSNATTVSTQETNEFRENLLSAEGAKEDEQPNTGALEPLSNGNYQTLTSTVSQPNAECLPISQASSDANQIVYVANNATNISPATGAGMANRPSDDNPSGGFQHQQQVQQMGQEMLFEYGQMPVNYYQNGQINGQINGQMAQFQYVSNSSAPMISSDPRMGFIGGDSMVNSNLVPVGYRDMSGGSAFPATNSFQASAGYPVGNEYFTFAECRDVNCPYTYCSRYNPYYNNFPSSYRSQFRPGFGDNFLPDPSTNMNLVDNQIVFSKQSDQPFNSVTAASQTAKTTKRTKRKQTKSEYTETSVICNESTDFAFFTLGENLQSKRKRGRKKKASASDAVPEPS